MSYIIRKTNPLISTKLTEKGREKLALGQLTFKYWAIGDSEINYGLEEIKDINPDDDVLNKASIISRPKDNQPNIKYFVTKTAGGSPYNTLGSADIRVSKLLINNRAEERGFFDIAGDTKSGSPYVISSGTVLSDNFPGTTGNRQIDIPGTTMTVGNYILFKMTNATLGAQGLNKNDEPTPHLWYEIESVAGTVYTLDRDLPIVPGASVNIQYIEYASGEIFENGMANDATTPYWDKNTLSFDTATNIQMDSVDMLNMNNIWASNIIGLNTDTAEEFFKYGSNDMIGVRSPFLCYVDTIAPSEAQLEDVCVDANGNTIGTVTNGDNKAISVIHYTNNSISNHYGEFFYIDDKGKTLEVDMPNILYHRRAFVGGTGTGDQMGMKFVADSEVYYIKNSDIEYVELLWILYSVVARL